MTRRQKWWMWELISFLALIAAVLLIPVMPWWKYSLLGFCFALYAICYRSQDRLKPFDDTGKVEGKW